jgi:glyoxylase-like metal-dependent hydrolase (beta-lactamase superfamily II)
MFWNKKTGNWIMKKLINVFFNITKFKPDFTIDEKSDLSKFGLDAEVIYLPGHSKGSIGILTSSGEFFCGDLFTNTKEPGPNSMVDDLNEFNESIDKIKDLEIKIVYPGHGKPFSMSSYSA